MSFREGQGPFAFPLVAYVEAPEITVADWAPNRDGTGPATQVHMAIDTGQGPTIILRFKSGQSLDELITALKTHREGVFGRPS